MTHTTDQERAEFELMRAEFEKIFGAMPHSCTWTGRGYCPTEFGAWDAQHFDQKFTGFVAAWQAARRAQVVPQVEVTNCMALAFHNAVTDGSIGEDDFNDIKTGLRAALAAAPKKPGFDASKLQKLLERLQFVTDEGPPDEGWKSTALEEGIAELERMLAAAPQPPAEQQAASRVQVVPMTLEQAQQSMRSATSHKPGKIIAASGLCAPQPPEEDSLMSEIRTSKTVATTVQMPEPEATVHSKIGTTCMFPSSNMRKGDKIYTEHQVSLLLAAAPQPQEAASVHMPEPISKMLEDCRSRAIDYATCPSPYNNTRMETAFQYLEHQVRQLLAAKGVKEKARGHDPANCWCQACDIATSQYGFRTRMSLCPKCGDKRCPRAQHHGFQCQSEKKD